MSQWLTLLWQLTGDYREGSVDNTTRKFGTDLRNRLQGGIAMPVGPHTKKFTWLLNDVEVRGAVVSHVLEPPIPTGQPIGTLDYFDIVPDPNYRHLISSVPGFGPVIHCEAYPLDVDDNRIIDRKDSWNVPRKPDDQAFDVLDLDTGQKRPLCAGDHVRLIGRWVIENGHPECMQTRQRGFLRVGIVWIELHPFRWNDIQLVPTLNVTGAEVETLSLAAPMYEECYFRGGLPGLGGPGLTGLPEELAGVAGKLFVAEDGSNFHNIIGADVHIKAPPLPTGLTGHSGLVEYQEEILHMGNGLAAANVRSIVLLDDGIRVSARIVAPVCEYVDGVGIADIQDPAHNKSVFQARYTVKWKPRILAVTSNLQPLDLVALTPQQVGSSTSFQVYLHNRGPDPLQITGAEISNAPPSVFTVSTVLPITLAAWSTIGLNGIFSPVSVGEVRGVLFIWSGDAACPRITIPLHGEGTAATPRPKVDISPATLDFGTVKVGQSVSATVTIRNMGTASAWIRRITKTGLLTNLLVPDLVPGRRGISYPPSLGEEQFQTPSGSNQYIPSGESCVVPIAYAPTSRGQANAQVTVEVDDGSGPTPSYRQQLVASLKGRAVAAKLVLDPVVLDFGAVAPCAARDLDLTIKNSGDADLIVAAISGNWLDGSFVLDPALNWPLPAIVPGGSAKVGVRFNASTVPGQRRAVEWDVCTDPPQTSPIRMGLTGISVGPHIEIWPDVVDFGRVGQPPAAEEIIIRNTGSSDLVVKDVVIHNPTPFAIVGLPAMPVTVAAGAEQRISIQFDSPTAGSYVDTLVAISNDGMHPKLSKDLRASI